MSRITPPAGMTECDGCGGEGFNGQDEDGKWYSCYRCGESGWMPVECLNEQPEPEPYIRRVAPAPYPRTDGIRAASSGLDDLTGDIPF